MYPFPGIQTLTNAASSVLLQSLLKCCREDGVILSQVGWLCIEELTLLRHRGAFSTVAQTFGLCCELVRTTKNTSTRPLLSDWYKVFIPIFSAIFR